MRLRHPLSRGGNGLSAARTDVLALLARARYEDGELAYAFEQATKRRVPPPLFP